MDTVARFEPRRVDLCADGEDASQPDPKQQLKVTATYLHSEEGRKTSLLAGGNGRAVQEITIHVTANRLHLGTATRTVARTSGSVRGSSSMLNNGWSRSIRCRPTMRRRQWMVSFARPGAIISSSMPFI
jgi:hypothetical protein